MPGHLLTIEEYAALGGTDVGFTELLEGRVVTCPWSGRRHDLAVCLLAAALERQLPTGLAFVVANDLDLGLSPDDGPGFARRPDLLILGRAALDRGERLLRAADVLLVVEVVAPGSKRTDCRVKHAEYADAGIPHYWIVDLAERVSVIACRLGGSGYVDAPAVTGTFVTELPFPARLDLDALIP
ncbi:Endonuclease, Uma2 family (restriction endonuclease fold) [Amycolatopsis tolypomycina]|uniref:Endonuclease, Uma2 family (Restriction endonuclease fold) n=1 Tax=Amycolatopsis tolypomycina TaxID=208445 RepID=A0A1H5CTD7_9PSEU|nr:Uma2 family endonuclease [Amycolatopsis tolypomycina]SED69883.1 Endonuclease, Uma2 family (restriction endonuclease fold) [Amycolatopsis tolypomycina]